MFLASEFWWLQNAKDLCNFGQFSYNLTHISPFVQFISYFDVSFENYLLLIGFPIRIRMICCWIGILIVQECSNAVTFDKILCSDSFFFHEDSLEFYHQGQSRKQWVSREYWCLKISNFFFYNGMLMDHNCQNGLWYGLNSVLELTFQQNKRFNFSCQGVILKFSTCCGVLHWKTWITIDALESWWIRKAKKKNNFLLDMPGFSNSYSFSALAASFLNQSVNR